MFRLRCQCGQIHEISITQSSGAFVCGCGSLISWMFQTGLSSNIWPQPPPPPKLPTIKSPLPIIGFRSWQYYKDRLYSNNRQFGHWWPGVNQARHRSTSRSPINDIHKAPDEHCECGIYVLADLNLIAHGPWCLYNGTEIVDNQVPRINGAVMGWGKVVAHEPEGWRASHAQIIGLLDESVVEYEKITMEGLAEYYKVPLLLNKRALVAYAAEYGETLAEKMQRST